MIITKYFAHKDLKHFKKGSVRFGTLVGYRKGEAHMFTDSKEGYVEDSFSVDVLGPVDLDMGGIGVGGNFSKVKGNELSTTRTINLHVFCASSGAYNRDHHLKMKEINPHLTDFVEISLPNFIIATLRQIEKSPYFVDDEKYPPILYGHVLYGDRTNHTNLTGEDARHFNYDSEIGKRNTLVIFTKPEEFNHENEFRIAVQLRGRPLDPEDETPMFISGADIKSSFLRFGTLLRIRKEALRP